MWQKNVRYLDYNAGSGLIDSVRKKLLELFQDESYFMANPSSRHRLGQKIQNQLHSAQSAVAQSLGVTPNELVFTSSGTEANQSVIRSCLKEVDSVVIGAGDHSASYEMIAEIQKNHPSISFLHALPLRERGSYDLVALKAVFEKAHALGQKKMFVSLAYANNETGVVTNLHELEKLMEAAPISVLLHLDGAQAWGKLPLQLKTSPAHYFTFSAHKIGAPAGTGVIWIRSNAPFHPLFLGEQAHGQRGGTENSMGILATGIAAKAIQVDAFTAHTRQLRDHLEEKLQAWNASIRIWGKDAERVPNTCRFSFTRYQQDQNWVELLDLSGYAVSNGSACRSNIVEPSRVLLLMGASEGEAVNSIRVSFGAENTLEDVDGFVNALIAITERKKTEEARA